MADGGIGKGDEGTVPVVVRTATEVAHDEFPGIAGIESTGIVIDALVSGGGGKREEREEREKEFFHGTEGLDSAEGGKFPCAPYEAERDEGSGHEDERENEERKKGKVRFESEGYVLVNVRHGKDGLEVVDGRREPGGSRMPGGDLASGGTARFAGKPEDDPDDENDSEGHSHVWEDEDEARPDVLEGVPDAVVDSRLVGSLELNDSAAHGERGRIDGYRDGRGGGHCGLCLHSEFGKSKHRRKREEVSGTNPGGFSIPFPPEAWTTTGRKRTPKKPRTRKRERWPFSGYGAFALMNERGAEGAGKVSA